MDQEENKGYKDASQELAEDKKLPLGEILVARGLISSDQLQIALRVQKDSNKSKLFGSILVDLGFVTEQIIADLISQSSGFKKLDLSTISLDSKIINQLPKETALKYKAVATNIEGDKLFIAITDVYNIMAIDQIKRCFAKNLKSEAVYATESQINEIINQYYSYDMSIDGILKEIENGIDQDSKTLNTNDYVNPTVRLVDAFLIDTIKRGASDIHLEPDATFVRVRYRIDGNLVQVRSFHKNYWQSVVVRIKIMAGMNIAESRLAQDGRISYNAIGRDVDFRVATQPTINGENIVLRTLDKKSSLVALDSLGLHPRNLNLLKKSLLRPEGIIIVTGPTGSGKTTTLYSILNHINTIEKNIMTLEDPVEYNLPLIRQTNIRDAAGLTFTDGIKAIMRQDPDIIFVGEVRDAESANMAIRAAMTGHQVFTTLHTNDAVGTIARLLDIGINRTILSGVISCIIAQRLVRRLCEHCKKPKVLDSNELNILNLNSREHQESPPSVYVHNGCEKCNFSGYKGRISINEVLYVDTSIDEMIATGATKNQINEYLKIADFLSMADDATYKILDGITDLDEVIANINVVSRM